MDTTNQKSSPTVPTQKESIYLIIGLFLMIGALVSAFTLKLDFSTPNLSGQSIGSITFCVVLLIGAVYCLTKGRKGSSK